MIPHIFVIRIPGIQNRHELVRMMAADGIPTGIHYKPNHQLTYYADKRVVLPVTESVYPEILTLPLHPRLKLKDLKAVVASLDKNLKYVN
jgi:dTDP-4-amino-4,6-dideoxygalactose transaminase